VYVMGHDGSLPRWFSIVHEKYRTPANAIMSYGLFAILLSLSGGFVFLAVMSTAVRLLIYVMCILTLPMLHKKLGEYEGQFSLPGGMAIPILAFLLTLWLMTHASLQSWLATGGFMLLGSIFYGFKHRK
jgi:APA family basic amino acid/polyamine antiporter